MFLLIRFVINMHILCFKKLFKGYLIGPSSVVIICNTSVLLYKKYAHNTLLLSYFDEVTSTAQFELEFLNFEFWRIGA